MAVEISCEKCKGFGDDPATLDPCDACLGRGYTIRPSVSAGPATADHAALIDSCLTAMQTFICNHCGKKTIFDDCKCATCVEEGLC